MEHYHIKMIIVYNTTKENHGGRFMTQAWVKQPVPMIHLKSQAERGVDEPVVQIPMSLIVMIADVVELAVGIDEAPPEIVSHGHPAVETYADTTVKRLVT